MWELNITWELVIFGLQANLALLCIAFWWINVPHFRRQYLNGRLDIMSSSYMKYAVVLSKRLLDRKSSPWAQCWTHMVKFGDHVIHITSYFSLQVLSCFIICSCGGLTLANNQITSTPSLSVLLLNRAERENEMNNLMDWDKGDCLPVTVTGKKLLDLRKLIWFV